MRPRLQKPGSQAREVLVRDVTSPAAAAISDHKLSGLTQHKSILLLSRGRSQEGTPRDEAHAFCAAALLLDTPGRGRGGPDSSPFPAARVCAHVPWLSARSLPLRPAALPSPRSPRCCSRLLWGPCPSRQRLLHGRLGPWSVVAASFLVEAPPDPRTCCNVTSLSKIPLTPSPALP